MKAQLAFLLAATSPTAFAASPINCKKAHAATEHTICSSAELLQADDRMTTYFEIQPSLSAWACVAIWANRSNASRRARQVRPQQGVHP